MPASPRTSLLIRLGTTAVALIALAFSLSGFYRLDEYSADRAAALGTENWMVYYGPPVWLLLVVVAGMALLGMSIAWRANHSQNARLLALFSALLACGYATLVTLPSSPFFEAYLAAVPRLVSAGTNREIVRALGYAVAAVERLLWLGVWSFAAIVAVQFVQATVRHAAPCAASHDEAVAFLMLAWTYVLPLIPHSPLARWVAIAWVGSVLAHRLRRKSATAARTSRWVLVAALLVLAQAWATAWGGAAPATLFAVIASTAMVPMMVAVARTGSNRIYLPAVFMALPIALTPLSELDAALTIGLVHVLVSVCIAAILWLVGSAIRSLPIDSSRQAFWLLSGFVIAGVAALIWKGASLLGGAMDCGPAMTGGFCVIYRYKEWAYCAPLPLLLLFFVVALSYRGHIDAATFFRRTAVYGTLMVLTIFGFGVLESVIANGIGNRLPWGTPPTIAAGTVAVLLHPAKQICDRMTDPLLKWLWGWAAQSPR